MEKNELMSHIESDRKKLMGKELHSTHIFTVEEYLLIAEYIFSLNKCFSVNYSQENSISHNGYGVIVRILI